MKYLKLTDIFSRIMIAAGIVIFGVIIYQIVFETINQPDTPRPRPRPAPARPRIRPRPVESTAALKEAANYLREIGTQQVPGFAEIKTFSHSGHYDSWDGKVQSWWEYSDRVDEKVNWRSAPCPEKETTTLVFSGVLGTAAGEARLFVNDQPALAFNTGFGPETEEWKEGDYHLKFFSIVVKANQERLGIFCLTVPEKNVTSGEPLTLSVRAEVFHKTGAGNSFFMLSGLPDSLKILPLSEPRQ